MVTMTEKKKRVLNYREWECTRLSV